MRKVLSVITALVLAAIVLAPVMGFTISTGARTNYSISSERVNYTIGSGTPAQETVYSEETSEHYTTYSIGSKSVPYSIKVGAIGKYSSVKAGTNSTKIEVLGGQKASVLGTSEQIGKGLAVPTEKVAENATEQAVGHVAPAAEPVSSNSIYLTREAAFPNTAANAIIPVNVTVAAKPGAISNAITTSASVTMLGNVTEKLGSNVSSNESNVYAGNVTKVLAKTIVTPKSSTSINQSNISVSASGNRINLALYKPANQSSLYYGARANASKGVDGSLTTFFCTRNDSTPWWQVDLGKVYPLSEAIIYNRQDCCQERARTLMVLLSNDSINWKPIYDNIKDNGGKIFGLKGEPLHIDLHEEQARFVRLQLQEKIWFHLAEVEIYGR